MRRLTIRKHMQRAGLLYARRRRLTSWQIGIMLKRSGAIVQEMTLLPGRRLGAARRHRIQAMARCIFRDGFPRRVNA
jgi:hypothetical protein